MIDFKKVLNAATAAAFGIMLSLPLLTFHHEEGRVSVLENKAAAAKPDISLENIFSRQLTEELETYFTDRIGMKDEATLLHICLMYRMFNRLAIPDYEMGKEQHVFYVPPAILNTYQGLDRIPEEALEALASKLEALSDSLQSVGKTFVFMPIPNKESIYGEYMPDDIHVISDESMLSSFTDYLTGHTAVRVADVENCLLQHKDQDQLLYYRNIDATHWNHYGMFWGYQALMDEIRACNPSVKRVSPNEVVIEREDARSAFLFLQKYDIARETFYDLEDYIYNIAPADGWHAVKDNAVPGCILSDDTQNRYFHYRNDSVANGKSLVVCGDSYIYSFMLPMLGESFSDVYFVAASCDEDELFNVLCVADPDVVVYETVARGIDYGRLDRNIEKLCGASDGMMRSRNIDRLPVDEDKAPAFRFDNPVINESYTVSLSGNRVDGNILITGWAADFAEYTPTGDVFFKIGNAYYPAERCERPDLGEALLLGGYRISIPERLLSDLSAIEAVALTADGLARLPGTVLQLMP